MGKKEIRLILSCCAVSIAAIMVAFTAFAATLNVPGTYATINDAIDAADAGDTVLCQPIDYTQSQLPVNFDGKAITVECADPPDCILDCNYLDSHGVIFQNDEGPNSRLVGFTIREATRSAILCGRLIKTSVVPATPTFPGSPTISNCTMTVNSGQECSGGIDSYDSSPTLVNCDINHNEGDTAGGACFFGGSPTITGGSITFNTAWDAGGIYNAQSPDSLTMTGVAVSYNSGHDVGGILCENASPTLTGCTISYNSTFWNGGSKETTSRGTSDVDFAYTGGAAFIGGSPTITGGTVTYNTGQDVGGIFATEGMVIKPTALNGGGPTLSGAVITFNSGAYTGGIEMRDVSPTISNCDISYNGTWGWWDDPIYFNGGAAFYGGSPTLSGNTVTYNTSYGTGGILHLYALNGDTSSAAIGGPIMSITGGNVSFNSAELTGGIRIQETSATITGVTVSDNTSFQAGGIGVFGDGDVEINKTYVTQNDGEVGGIRAQGTNSPIITNSMITGNTGFVAGIGCDSGEISLMNCTIADNIGGAVGGIGSEDDSAISVINSILWGNTPSQVDTGVAATVGYSDVQGGHAGTGNINANPMFLAAGDYHIFLASPCVDVGTADGAPADDIDGDVRPQGAGIDMGADENLPDDDGDGVPSGHEMGPDGDPGYDGNDDGVPDWTQGNVSSFPTVDGGNYVTIECPDPSFFVNVAAAPNPSPSNTPPGVTFPYGFFSFRINNLPTGGATTVTIHLSGPVLDDYWKYGRTPDDPANHWYLFPIEEDADGDVTGAENIGDTTTRLHFVDGKRGDNDLTANGTVIDPGAPGVPGAADVFNPEFIEDKSDSVCFIGTAADSFGF